MTTYELWEKAVRAKQYTKTVVTNRILVLKRSGALTEAEHAQLLLLIEEVYGA